ncbi:MAG: 4Fe-4S binding protein, partial [Bacteroidaceae bacterium]
CKFEDITVDGNLANIDPDKCKMCRKCEDECPRGAIHAINFPPRKPKTESPVAPKTDTPAASKSESSVAPKAEAPEISKTEEKA